jgi:hypothetical protein
MARMVVYWRPGEHDDRVAGAEGAAVDHAGVAASTAGLAQHPLHRKPAAVALAQAVLGGPPAGLGRLQRVEHGRAVVPGCGVGALDHVVAVEGGDRDHRARGDAEPAGQRSPSRRRCPGRPTCPSRPGPSCWRRPRAGPPRAGRRCRCAAATVRAARRWRRPAPGPGRRGGAGGHVAGVLDVAGAVGDDELAVRRGGVAVGHVDGDALLALGPQAVGDEGQVDLAQSPPFRRVEMASSWSSKSWRVSKRRRPIRVLFPSSTDPMVAKRNRSMVSAPSSGPPAGGELGTCSWS